MTFRYSFAAVAAVFSVALFLAPSAHAEQQKTAKTEVKQPVIVIVQPGDSLTSIAQANNSDYVRLFDANNFISNPDIINPGDKVRIPDANEQLPDRLASFDAQQASDDASAQTIMQPSRSTSYVSRGYSHASNSGNTYYPGYCTWYAKSRRPDLPNMLGNGGQWVARAAELGYATGTAPRAGAIAETTGHVAYVEAVNGDGTITISEMNGPGGFGVVDTRTVPASQYDYIY